MSEREPGWNKGIDVNWRYVGGSVLGCCLALIIVGIIGGGIVPFDKLSGRTEAPPDIVYRIMYTPPDGKVRVWHSHHIGFASASDGGPIEFRDAMPPNLLVYLSGSYVVEEIKQR